MKLHYYSETDTLYIELRSEPSVDSQEVSPGIVLDFNSDGRLVGIDVDHAVHYEGEVRRVRRSECTVYVEDRPKRE